MENKTNFMPVVKPNHFSEVDKEVIRKVVAAVEIQETQCFVDTGNPYTSYYSLKWGDIFPLLTSEKELNSGLGYFIYHYGWKMYNDLIDIFDEIFEMPVLPEGLSSSNLKHRKTPEYIEYHARYKTAQREVIKDILITWETIKKDVLVDEKFKKEN